MYPHVPRFPFARFVVNLFLRLPLIDVNGQVIELNSGLVGGRNGGGHCERTQIDLQTGSKALNPG